MLAGRWSSGMVPPHRLRVISPLLYCWATGG